MARIKLPAGPSFLKHSATSKNPLDRHGIATDKKPDCVRIPTRWAGIQYVSCSGSKFTMSATAIHPSHSRTYLSIKQKINSKSIRKFTSFYPGINSLKPFPHYVAIAREINSRELFNPHRHPMPSNHSHYPDLVTPGRTIS